MLIVQPLLMTGSPARAAKPSVGEAASVNEVAARAVVDANYGKLPLSFEINRGQADKQVKFLARAGSSSLLLKNDEAVLTLSREEKAKDSTKAARHFPLDEPPSRRITATVKMKLLNANPNPRIVGLEEQQAKSSYFVGSDPKQWTTDVPNYAKEKYEQVYPGIDLIFYGNPQKLEYDFVVAPGADPKQIKLNFAGAQKMRMDVNGDLLLQTKAGEVRQHKPVMYQEVNGERRAITGRYLLSGGQVGFEVGAYNASKPLVIDPIIVYATFFGGDGCRAVAVDKDGNAYVSAQIPATPGAFKGEGEYSVSKLNAAGTALIYSATFVIEQSDRINDLAVDAAGNCYFTGTTKSATFPTTPGAFQTSFGRTGNNFYNAFVTKLNAAGNTLLYSTFLGGDISSANEGKSTVGYAIALDAQGNAYVTGRTIMADFPVTPGAYQTSIRRYPFEPAPLAADAFVTKLNPTGSGLVYSTFLGAADAVDAGHGIAVDAAGNAYVSGVTGNGYIDVRRPQGGAFPITPGAYLTTDTYSSSGQFLGIFAFVTKFNRKEARWSTQL
ncbi:MAG: SBBP repeat-containing protein [Acidobacteriota bacterium]